MTPEKFSTLSSEEKARWLNDVSAIARWRKGNDVFCLHCNGVFKVEDIACDNEGDPTCPVCRSATPLDFHHLPWWREDLISENGDGIRLWRKRRIEAIPGQPQCLDNFAN